MTPELIQRLDDLIGQCKAEVDAAGGSDSPANERLQTALEAKSHIEWQARMRGIYLRMPVDEEARAVPLGWRQDWTYPVTRVHCESVDERAARIVATIPLDFAERLQAHAGIPLHPAPLDATESLVRATDALAGAAAELAGTAKKLGEKL